MKHLITALGCALSITCHGQAEWTSLFQADPIQADGYFIVDLPKASSLGVSHVEVGIIASELQSDGSTQDHVIETLEIDLAEGFFAQLDFDQWTQLADPFRIHYHARGLAPGGTVVIEVQQIGGDGYPWPEVCRETCVSNLYAYTLVAYSNGALAEVHLHDGTLSGNYTYVYVRASNWHDQPGGFKHMFQPSHFGISGLNWSELALLALGPNPTAPYANYLKKFTDPNQVPSDARDYMGFLLEAVNETVYAIKRGKGPWEGLITPTSPIAAQALYNCGMGQDVLRALYDDNSDVQNAMSIQDMDALECHGWVASGGGQSWGSTPTSGLCPWDITWAETTNFTPVVIMYIVDCASIAFLESPGIEQPLGGSRPDGGYVISDVSSAIVNQWTGSSVSEIMSIPIQSIGDPRLWPIPRQEVPPGLYEFIVVMNDGSIHTRFVDFGQHTILQADFASFTNVNIYPVPVTDRHFAIDIDLGLPTSINLTVVNNMGHQFHSKVLDYDLPGEHKHVVSMTSQWPNGIYHAIFQFPDGSSSSVSFTVSDQ